MVSQTDRLADAETALETLHGGRHQVLFINIRNKKNTLIIIKK